jgi:hypothetical protein
MVLQFYPVGGVRMAGLKKAAIYASREILPGLIGK